jgi:hypothetical protein
MSIVPKRIRPCLSPVAELCCPAALLGNPATSQQVKGPQAPRPRLTTGLPFSLAHTDALGCTNIPHACYECTIH